MPRPFEEGRGIFLGRSVFIVPSAGPPWPWLVSDGGQRRRDIPSQYRAVAESSFDLQVVEPQEFGLAYLQTAHIGGEGTFYQHTYPFRGYFTKPRLFSVPQICADRDLGSGASSMVETLQVKNGQSASFLDVLQCLGGERNGYLSRSGGAFTDRCTEAKPLDVKPRRHDVPAPCRLPVPGLP